MDDIGKLVFQFFNEVGIIQQLGSTMFNKRLPDGLHVSHFSVLNHLIRLGDGKTPLSLARAFQVTKGTMTHTLATLSKRNLIRLAPHETDGRSKVVFLTEEGRLFHRQAIENLGPAIMALDDKIDWEKVVELLPELRRIRSVLDNNRGV
ncbi:MAG: MarR family winged helix-turn-helix transcriptional regulator [Inquilinaceae bacterium]